MQLLAVCQLLRVKAGGEGPGADLALAAQGDGDIDDASGAEYLADDHAVFIDHAVGSHLVGGFDDAVLKSFREGKRPADIIQALIVLKDDAGQLFLGGCEESPDLHAGVAARFKENLEGFGFLLAGYGQIQIAAGSIFPVSGTGEDASGDRAVFARFRDQDSRKKDQRAEGNKKGIGDFTHVILPGAVLLSGIQLEQFLVERAFLLTEA